MKTTPFLLLLLFLAACSTPPQPAYETWKANPDHEKRAANARQTTTPATATVKTNGLGADMTSRAVAMTEQTTHPETNAVPSQPFARTAEVTPTAVGAPGVLPAPPGPAAVNPGAAAVGAGAAAGVASPAQASLQSPDELVPAGMIAFQNAPLEQVLEVYAAFVNRTLLRPQTLNAQQQITLKTQTALTRSEVKEALDGILALNGITMIDYGDKFVKVVPQAQAGQEGAPTDTRDISQMGQIGQYVTHVVQLKYLKPSEVLPAITPLAKLNAILPIETSGILVLRDYTENVKRMLEMIQRIDIALPSEIVSEVIFIRYAKASEIADAINALSGGSAGGSVGRPQQTTPRSTTGPGGQRGGLPNYQGGLQQPLGGTQPIGGGAGAAGAGGTLSDRLNQIIRRASASGELTILGQTKMIADDRSNSLLIFASRQDLDMIKNIVTKLDVVLPQVLIETVIMDINMDNTWAFGVSAAQGPHNITGNAQGAGGFNNSQQFFNWLGSISSNAFPGNTTSVLPPGFSYFAHINDDEWNIAVQAAAADSRVNVIQKPRILTTHAKEASVFIGNTVPYVTSTYYNGGFGGGPSSSYQQLQVGIGLSVVPYINPDGLVVMELEETIDEISGSTQITGVGAVPNTTSRKFSAEVAVKDGDSVILGGFIRNSTDKQVSGVPVLKDIPIIGWLFTTRTSAKSRKELIVMMRPTVLRTPELAALATVEEKKRLPGVSSAETEYNAEEKKYTEHERRAARRSAAFSHEEDHDKDIEVMPFEPKKQ
jgi:general secretion pathway protein D